MERYWQHVMREPPTIEFVAYCLMQAPGVGAVTLRAALNRLARGGISSETFLQLDDAALRSRYGLKPAAIAALREPDKDTLETWRRLRSDFVKVLVLGIPDPPTNPYYIGKFIAKTEHCRLQQGLVKLPVELKEEDSPADRFTAQ